MPSHRADGTTRRRGDADTTRGAPAHRRADTQAQAEAVDGAAPRLMTRREYRALMAQAEAATAVTEVIEVAAVEAAPAAPAAPPLPSRRELRIQQARLEAARAEQAKRARAASWTCHLPRVGIVGVLGLATVVAPMVTQQTGNAVGSAFAGARGAVVATQPEDTGGGVPITASEFRVIPTDRADDGAPRLDTAGTVLTPEQLTAARMQAEKASRDLVRPILPGCDGVVEGDSGTNGRMDPADMCDLWQSGHLLRADAAVALAKLNAAYQEAFGEALVISDSYRSYAAQVRVRAQKPGLAARPGTSEHGWGLAVDLAGGVQEADRHYAWLRQHAPALGWDNPDWARRGGSGPYEPWHWEYVAGEATAAG